MVTPRNLSWKPSTSRDIRFKPQYQLKCPCDKKKKITSFLFFTLWKCVCLTLDWQNFELWFISKGRLLWVLVLDFTIRHYSRSNLTDWTSEGWIQGKVTSKAHQLKISVCERSLLYMQSASLKVWKPKTPVLHIIRDLKHQDGRWRRRRHIRVKAGARPTLRCSRLSMLSNTATATSRQFSKRTTLLKCSENMASFAKARDDRASFW